MVNNVLSLLDEYQKYFTWKYDWRIDYRVPICALCEKLNTKELAPSVVDIDELAEETGCVNGRDLPWMITR